jgi:hypothetical protein
MCILPTQCVCQYSVNWLVSLMVSYQWLRSGNRNLVTGARRFTGPGNTLWYLRQTKWTWDEYCSEYSCLFASVSFHQCSVFVVVGNSTFNRRINGETSKTYNKIHAPSEMVEHQARGGGRLFIVADFKPLVVFLFIFLCVVYMDLYIDLFAVQVAVVS